MATHSASAVAAHRFAYGYYRQEWWNWLIATAFFCGGLGGGLFLVSQLTGETLGMVVGYLVVMVGKNTAHLLYLGRPERFWRAAMRPDRSWIARGIWATGILGVAGFLHIAPLLFGPGWQIGGTAGTLAAWLAGIAALFIMFYDGMVMNSSRAIPFWNTGLLPMLILMYAALGGATLSLTLRGLFDVGASAKSNLMQLEQFLLVANMALLGGYVLWMSRRLPAARETVRLLLGGVYARAFLGLVVAVGLGATFLLSVVESRLQADWLLLVIAACELTGDFTLLIVFLKSGLFSPQTARAYVAG